MSNNNFQSQVRKIVLLVVLLVSTLGLNAQSYPSPRVNLQHILSLTGDSTIISVNSGTVVSKVCKDNLGSAAFTTTGSNSTTGFWYDQTGKTYTWDKTSLETDLKNLGLPSSRVYNVYNDAGGVYNGLDMLANVCNKNNISQDKMIICLETWQASSTTDVLDPTVYASAVRYCKSKGYTFKYWEISNEPQYAWGSGIDDPVTYAKHVRACYDSIKSVDPNAMVGNQICRKSYYSDQVLSNLNGKSDFIAGHWYGGLCNMDNYGTEDIILGDNYKTLDFISYENKNILSKTGKAIPQIDSEWRLLADATVNGVSYTGEWNPRVGNIVGTLYQATRLIYTMRDNYTYGANCWHIMGAQPGCLIPAGYNASGSLDGKTTYMYWLYYYMTHNTGDNVIEFSGKAPSYTSTVANNVDDGSQGNLTYTGPLTPLMVTKSSDGTKLYITIVNGSTTKTVPFAATINSFSITGASAVRISSTNINDNWYANNNSGFVSNPTITTNGSKVSCSLPPLSFTIITLSTSSTSQTLSAPVLSAPSTEAANQAVSLNLSWGAVTNATSYELQVSTSSAFTTNFIYKTGLTSTSYAVTGLSNNTKYYWRVIAKNSSISSSWSSVWNFTTVIAVPSVPSLSSPANGATGQSLTSSLTWASSTNATSYSVQVSASSDFSTVLFSNSSTALSFSLSGLSNNTTYYWRVNASNSGGTSSWSSVWSFKTLEIVSTNRQQVITLNAGWNIISFNVIPEDNKIIDIVKPLIDEGSLVKMQDEKGNFMTNTKNGWFNNMDTLNYRKGYLINVSFNTQLSVTGTPVKDTITIPLNKGFNIIAYPKTKSMVAKTGFQKLMDEGSLLKVQDEKGNYIMNLTSGSWLVRLDSLLPNKGYYVNVKSNTSVNFGSASTLSTSVLSTSSDSTYFTKSFSGNPYSSMNLIISNLYNSGISLSAGDEIAVFDGSKCVGVYKYNNEDIIGMAAGMTDAAASVSGYTSGDSISIKVWDSETNSIIVPELSFYTDQTATFTTQGTTVLEIKNPESSTKYSRKTVSTYPNPMKTDCKIKFTLDTQSDVSIEIFEMNGNKAKQICNGAYEQGEYEITWDGTKVNGERVKPGMYFYRFTAGNMLITNKILVIN
jgi:hypothetical protein